MRRRNQPVLISESCACNRLFMTVSFTTGEVCWAMEGRLKVIWTTYREEMAIPAKLEQTLACLQDPQRV